MVRKEQSVPHTKGHLDLVLQDVRKKYGDQALMTGEEFLKKNPRRYISTGCFAIDAALGGGIPVGVISEIFGSPGSGKTTLACHVVANSLKRDQDAVAFYLLTEGDYPYEAVSLFGIPQDRFYVILQREHGERTLGVLFDTLNKMRPHLECGDLKLGALVFDSVAGLLPSQDIEGIEKDGFDKQSIGTHARLMSTMLRRFGGSGLFRYSPVIFLNQTRNVVSTVPLPPDSTGGNAVKFWSKLRMKLQTSSSRKVLARDIRAMAAIPGIHVPAEDKVQVGHEVDLEISKNNTGFGFPGARTTYRVIYGYGYDNYTSVLNEAIASGLVRLSGNTCSWRDVRVVGRNNFLAQLVSMDRWNELEQEVRQLIFHKQGPVQLVSLKRDGEDISSAQEGLEELTDPAAATDDEGDISAALGDILAEEFQSIITPDGI